MRRALPVIVGLWLAFAASARAQESDDPQRIFLRGAAAYGSGDYETAAELFARAYELRPEPALLLNLGLARERAGLVAPAIEAYEAFLEAAPDAVERPDVERSLETLRRQRALEEEVARREAERAAAESAAAESMVPPDDAPRPRERSIDPLPWVVLGAGVLSVAIGGVLGGLALSRYDQARGEATHERTLALQQEANDLALPANVLFGVGGAIALVGLLWGSLAIALDGGSQSTDVALRLGPLQVHL